MEGLLGEQVLEDLPEARGPGVDVEDDHLKLAFRAVGRAFFDVALGDGQLEVFGRKPLQISEHGILHSVTFEFSRNVDFEVITEVVAVVVDRVDIVHYQVTGLVEDDSAALVIVPQEGVELSRAKSTSML
jgi:hypothetical protein